MLQSRVWNGPDVSSKTKNRTQGTFEDIMAKNAFCFTMIDKVRKITSKNFSYFIIFLDYYIFPIKSQEHPHMQRQTLQCEPRGGYFYVSVQELCVHLDTQHLKMHLPSFSCSSKGGCPLMLHRSVGKKSCLALTLLIFVQTELDI